MQKDSHLLGSADLFGRVVSILETARTHVVRSVNSEMVTAYWLIGREIVEEIENGWSIRQLERQIHSLFFRHFERIVFRNIRKVLKVHFFLLAEYGLFRRERFRIEDAVAQYGEDAYE